ncbi:MAG: anion permease [Flavobacteriales bacterium]|nr:MAG: anion permease [Flavobacteriales bacterium]
MPQRWLKLGICVLAGIVLWFLPVPDGLTVDAWHFFSVFIVIIFSFVLNPFPMGPMVLLGLVTLSATQTIKLTEALSGYGDKTVWLVVAAFLIAGAVKQTGLGKRIALTLVSKLGKSTLGLGYSLCGAELILGPVVPSNTARGGGILAPISRSLSEALHSFPDKNPERAGRYLSLVGAHANLITAAMFLTGMAANPLVAKAAKDIFDVEFGWGMWALGAIVPGLIGLALLPVFLIKIIKPTLEDAQAAQQAARDELKTMGKWTAGEKTMLTTMVALLLLWSTAQWHGMGTTLVAWFGVCALIFTNTHNWQNMVKDAAAWDTLIWLGGLLSMASGLKDIGVIDWFSQNVQQYLEVYNTGGLLLVVIVSLVYFYSMYGFSMLTAHITALAGAFLAVCLNLGTPTLLTVALIAYFSNLCGCLTNYSTGPVIIYFGLGYVKPKQWFSVGFLISLFHLVIWLGIGLWWWKLLGWW